MAKYLVEDTELTTIANAIRTKSGGSDPLIFPGGFSSAISSIATGGEMVDNYAPIINGTVKELNDSNSPGVTSIRANCFNGDAALETVNLTNLLTLGEKCFENTTALRTFVAPNLITVGRYAFRYNKLIESVVFPKATSSGYCAFEKCTALKRVDYHVVSAIGDQWSFCNCTALEAVIIRSAEMAILQRTNCFDNSGVANGTGYIYVPSNLKESYINDANWSTYASQIRAIEDYPDITGV